MYSIFISILGGCRNISATCQLTLRRTRINIYTNALFMNKNTVINMQSRSLVLVKGQISHFQLQQQHPESVSGCQDVAGI